MNPTRKLLPALATAALLLATSSHQAHATVVERVVAVVGDRPVFWSDLLHRATPSRAQILAQAADPNVVSVQETEMYRELLDRMIDDRLEEQQADKAHVSVSPEEIDRAITSIATQAQAQQGRPVAPRDVIDEVRRRGMTEQDFRDEIRRQILEGKLTELRVRPRVRVTEQDARTAYQHFLQETIEVRTIALLVRPPEESVAQAKLALARTITQQARAGVSFCKLVAQFSGSASTGHPCGSTGPQPLSSLHPAIQAALRGLAPGEVSAPIDLQSGPDRVIVVLQPLAAPAFEEMKGEMMQKALLDGLERARRQWLQELRQNAHVDVRL